MTGPIPNAISGRYFPPGSAHSVDAELSDGGSHLKIRPADGAEIEAELREVSDRLGSVPRKIYFQDGGIFETPDNDAIDLAFGRSGHFFSRLARFEASWKFVSIATVLTFASLFVLYRYGVPFAANVAAKATPDAIVTAIDSGASDTVDRLLFSPTELPEERQQELTQLFEEIVEASPDVSPRPVLYFRKGERIGANAIALPGGTIILTDELEALVENDDEIAGVFAHEIGHVADRHSLRQIYRVLGLTFLISFIGGDSGQIVEEVLGQAVLLESFSYTREFERDADDYSVRVMTSIGRDPEAFLNLLDRVVAEYGLDPDRETSWMDTHPGNKDRRENVRKQIEQIGR